MLGVDTVRSRYGPITTLELSYQMTGKEEELCPSGLVGSWRDAVVQCICIISISINRKGSFQFTPNWLLVASRWKDTNQILSIPWRGPLLTI